MSFTREQIIALVRGELNQGEAAGLMKELAQSPEECRFLLDQIRISQNFRRVAGAVVPAAAADRAIWEEINRIESGSVVPAKEGPAVAPPVRGSGVFRNPLFWFGAALVLLLLGGAWWSGYTAHSDKAEAEEKRTAPTEEPEIPSGTKESLPEFPLSGTAGEVSESERSEIGTVRNRIGGVEREVASESVNVTPPGGNSGRNAGRAEASPAMSSSGEIRMLAFDGIDDCVVEADSKGQISPGRNFTVEAYVLPESLNAREWIFAYSTADAGATILFGFDNGRLRLTVYDRHNTSNNVIAFTPLYPGIWYHVAGVQNKERNVLQVFVNGRLEGEAPIGSIDSAEREGTVYLGGWENPVGSSVAGPFRGLIREVRYWNRALNQDDIAGSLGRPGGASEPPPTAHWSLSDGRQKEGRSEIAGMNGMARILGGAQWRSVRDIVFATPHNVGEQQ